MGQMTLGIMWGVQRPKGLHLYDDNAEDGGVAEEYARHDRRKITEAGIPDDDEDRTVIGMWVAVGASGKRGIPSLNAPVALDALATTKPYAAALPKAQERWARFAKWLHEERAILLPEPRLWLVPVEIA